MKVRVEVVVGDGDENAKNGDQDGYEVVTVDSIMVMAAGGGDLMKMRWLVEMVGGGSGDGNDVGG